ncbi:hypothetical protein [Kribbella solani]|nr:hypothetical protein [Kribbella solani]MDX2974212.1 hypothetical protein [Kribbella solani]
MEPPCEVFSHADARRLPADAHSRCLMSAAAVNLGLAADLPEHKDRTG